MKTHYPIILEQLRKFMLRNGILDTERKIVLALSGGPDSILLFRALNDLVPNKIHAAHCNYEQRGVESNHDQEFVVQLCNELNVELSLKRWSEWPSKLKKGNFQEKARELRYHWMSQICEELGANVIMTGHHLTDQLENFLMSLGRGSGLKGLKGMKEVNRLIYRPLLQIKKEVILQSLEEIGQEYRTDTSNASQDYLRNRVRLEILPALEKVFPLIQDQFLKSNSALQSHWDAWQESDAAVELNFPFTPSSESDWLSFFYDQQKHGLHRMQYTEIRESIQQSEKKLFPIGAYVIAVSRGMIYKLLKEKFQDFSFSLRPGIHSKGQYSISIDEVIYDSVLKLSKNEIILPYEFSESNLSLRPPLEGEKMKVFGMKGKHKKIQDISTDLKLNPSQKDDLLILSNDTNEIFWLVGHVASEHGRVKNGQKCYLLQWKGLK